jgi:hypothetical protein
MEPGGKLFAVVTDDGSITEDNTSVNVRKP